MNNKLYVGGINYDTTDKGLADAFSEAGTVEEAKIIVDKMTGRSKGFGFVTMASPEEAQAAIEMWNGKELDGRTIKVDEARPMRPRNDQDEGGNF